MWVAHENGHSFGRDDASALSVVSDEAVRTRPRDEIDAFLFNAESLP
jgi:hypothetical protein